MGKRKRKADNSLSLTPPPTGRTDTYDCFKYLVIDIPPCAPREVLQLEQNSSGQAESSARQSVPSIMDVPGSSLKTSPDHQSPVNQNHASSRSMLMKHARHTISRHYSRRSSTSQFDASPSKWSGTPPCDSKLNFKMSGKDPSDVHYKESMDRSFHKPKRERSSSSLLKPMSPNMRNIECGICQKRLQKKPFILDDSIQTCDLSVVAVLVCGHAYHADCLEQKTKHEDRHDPLCPLCGS